MSTRYVATCDECGFTGKYKSESVASYALTRHSCETVKARAARAARVRARLEDPGVRRDCDHKQAHHEHGTRTAYVLDKCRCRPCRDATAKHAAKVSKAKAYGRYDAGRVDAEPVREHVRELMSAGVGLKRIAALAPVSSATLGKLMYGVPTQGIKPRKRCDSDVAERLMAVQPGVEVLAGGAVVNGPGTQRRLQALAWLGYSVAEVARRSGLDRQRLDGALSGRPVTAHTARAIAELYNELWDTPNSASEWRALQPAARARNLAIANGWAPPLAWDDIDDPDEVPEGAAPASRWGHAEDDLADDVHHLLRAGVTADEIAARLGKKVKTMERQLARAGHHRLASWLHTGEEPAKEAAS